ncbi:DUF4105 domain-containing protein [uncultured Psychrobacter sp.]|uniref:Lnb N-terminal periplasmic domain-containing protein n=1 Tax=uncultured Psychrobacter sp. TaxID=259303 RepID=UPI00345747A4
MSPRSFFSKLLSSRNDNNQQLTQNQNDSPYSQSWKHRLMRFFIIVTLILSAIWLLLAIWYQFGATSFITWLTTIVIIGLLIPLLSATYHTKLANKIDDKLSNKKISNKKLSRWLAGGYAFIWLAGLGWFFSIEAKQDRNWQPEVSQVITYERDANNPDLITFSNVRNFDWHTPDEADERWDTRTVDMSKLSGVDVSNSYWMGPLIAHTLVSFRFEDDRPLAFSFEIRKEEDESFSALAGFFRRYELSLIGAEERDIIYTRSNARGEQVYLFPISHLQHSEVKALFESYLIAADELNTKPAWYNTLVSNCTNIIFYMARIVSGDRLPWDYRIWVSGWLPNYLYDVGMLDANPQLNKEQRSSQPWSMDTWYERTHINPKTQGFDNEVSVNADVNSREFSAQIRQGIPIPPLADSKVEAEARAQSAAEASEE